MKTRKLGQSPGSPLQTCSSRSVSASAKTRRTAAARRRQTCTADMELEKATTQRGLAIAAQIPALHPRGSGPAGGKGAIAKSPLRKQTPQRAGREFCRGGNSGNSARRVSLCRQPVGRVSPGKITGAEKPMGPKDSAEPGITSEFWFRMLPPVSPPRAELREAPRCFSPEM
ncbi:hypothetical protein SKAU_G00389560 [Synaphobranchus kaupii]|uniref:Uncharacterized protein n=1 Tax=Synaphobranchus kaupii TaxID=118154 RepID=A0A9Q1EB77_SYNKA|nr:hypothetical protein SKAU_G00389560 [Synaphobranchus kaupii]